MGLRTFVCCICLVQCFSAQGSSAKPFSPHSLSTVVAATPVPERLPLLWLLSQHVWCTTEETLVLRDWMTSLGGRKLDKCHWDACQGQSSQSHHLHGPAKLSGGFSAHSSAIWRHSRVARVKWSSRSTEQHGCLAYRVAANRLWHAMCLINSWLLLKE